jgi:hypothetical protein
MLIYLDGGIKMSKKMIESQVLKLESGKKCVVVDAEYGAYAETIANTYFHMAIRDLFVTNGWVKRKKLYFKKIDGGRPVLVYTRNPIK